MLHTKESRLLLYITLLPATLYLFACSRSTYPLAGYSFKSESGIPDYSNYDYWAAHPYKKDPSDSIPRPLKKGGVANDSLADVFFIHPTTFTDNSASAWNAAIDDANLNGKTDYSTILYQASVFNQHCRIFAPRYRQAHYRAFFIPDSLSAPYFNLAYEDIKAAFQYYLDHFNNSRPIIIAAHSQGTVHAARLLKEFFQDKPLASKLVCAYLIGMPVPQQYFTKLLPCTDSTSTGCIVSWRTFKKGYTEPNFVAKEKFTAIVTNPLSWTSSGQPCSRSLNKGGVLKNFNKIVPGVVSTVIHQNVLWSSKPKFFGNIFLTKKNYHIADINLFYVNIRQNAATRINAYLKK